MQFKTYFYLYMINESTKKIRKKKTMYDETLDGKPYGRKRNLSVVGCLGLVLMWYHKIGSCTRSLWMIFGQNSTPMYKWLKFDRKVLLFAIMDDVDTKIAHPTDEEARYYQSAIGNKYPSISEVWVVADGLKCTLECPELGSE